MTRVLPDIEEVLPAAGDQQPRVRGRRGGGVVLAERVDDLEQLVEKRVTRYAREVNCGRFKA